jgi:hypothetical protein
MDRLVVSERLWLGVQGLKHLILQPWHRSRTSFLRGMLSRPAGHAEYVVALFARQVQAGEFADDGVSAHADVIGDLAAGQPGFKAAFQEFEAFGSPGGLVGEHVDVPN